jgi:hypothetical protein
MDTLTKYIKLANHPEQLGVAISCDDSDMTMSRNLVHEELHRILARTSWHRIFTSPNTSKIEACNANMNEIDWNWDIVVLVSDDMIPRIQGYDDVIRNHMLARFPDTDGILWFNDGYRGEELNTLNIFGRKMYERLGFMYNPVYKSFFCDNEITDLCKGELKEKSQYIPYSIIRHEHPGTGFAQNMDSLYQRNSMYFYEDAKTYIARKKYPYHWSVLIPTLSGREQSLHKLLQSISEKVQRICPELTYEVRLFFDNKEATVGAKRQQLLQAATGKYLSFIDDDDDITDQYIEDLWTTVQGNYDVMRLYGVMSGHVFMHSLDIKTTHFMASQTMFQRPPNHLNPVLSDLVKLVSFGDTARGEDLDWSIRLSRFGVLQSEFKSNPSHVHYIYNLGPRTVAPAVIENQRKITFEQAMNIPSLWGVSNQSQGLRLGPRGFVSK